MRVSEFDSVKYQLITELSFVKKELVIPSDIELLAVLAIWGAMSLSEFCQKAAVTLNPGIEPQHISLRSQNIRNKLTKLTKRGFVEKSDDPRKLVRLDPSLNIVTGRNILLNFNLLTIESDQT